MIRTLIWLFTAVILAFLYLPFILVFWLFRSRKETAGPNKAAAAMLKPAVLILAKVAGAKVIVKGKENLTEDASLYVGNHQSDFDALIALSYLGSMKSMVIKKELMKIPVVNLLLEILAGIPLDRENMRQSLKAIKTAGEKIKAGNSVLIFPEGTRSKGPDMGEFKHGAFKAALDAKAPITVFAIDGSYKCLEENHRLKAAMIYLSILPVIRPEEYEGMKASALGEMVQERIREELSDMRKTY